MNRKLFLSVKDAIYLLFLGECFVNKVQIVY